MGSSKDEALGEICRLLGGMVSPLLRDAAGGLDLLKIPAKNFPEFKEFLQDQAAQNDGMSFRNPYEKLLKQEKYAPLLKALYESRSGSSRPTLPPLLLSQFQSDLLRIDADRFAQAHFSSPQGRTLLRRILADARGFHKEERSDLVKAIAKLGEQEKMVVHFQVRAVTDQISPWNIFNWFVTDNALHKASLAAEEILDAADHLQQKAERIQRKEDRFRDHVSLLSEEYIGHKITHEDFQRFTQLAQEKSLHIDPSSRAQAHLAQLWLLTARHSPWNQEDPQVLSGRGHVIRQVEALVRLTEKIKTEEDFLAFQKKLQNFLEGPLQRMATVEESALQRTARELAEGARFHLLGRHLPSLFADVRGDLKAPYEQLVALSEGWSACREMGERIHLERTRGHSDLAQTPLAKNGHPPPLAKLDAPEGLTPSLSPEEKALRQLILGLEDTKAQLWRGYRQHKALSRVLSAAADPMGLGDRQEIRKANQFLDQSLSRLTKAQSKEEVEQEIQTLFQALQKKGVLFEAFAAAEMDGVEQTLGMIQSVAIALAVGTATRGIGAVAQVNGALVNSAFSVTAAQMGKGFSIGAATMLAENTVAVISREARPGPETAEAWVKDLAATGLSTTLTGLLPASPAARGNLMKNILGRYATGGLRGAGHFGRDAAVEVTQESLDQITRRTLEGDTQGLSLNELREIATFSALGGSVKVGAIAEAIRPSSSPRLSFTHPLLAPMWMAMGSAGIGGGGPPFQNRRPPPTLPVGESWRVTGASPDPKSQGWIFSFEPYQYLPGEKFDLHFGTRRGGNAESNPWTVDPQLREILDIRFDVKTGHGTYPDLVGLNQRLEDHGMAFRFWEPRREKGEVHPHTGEATAQAYFDHLTSEVPEFPLSGEGTQHFHDMWAHPGVTAQLKPEGLLRVRDAARAIRENLRLIEELSGHPVDPAKQQAMIREFVSAIDTLPNMIAQSRTEAERALYQTLFDQVTDPQKIEERLWSLAPKDLQRPGRVTKPLRPGGTPGPLLALVGMGAGLSAFFAGEWAQAAVAAGDPLGSMRLAGVLLASLGAGMVAMALNRPKQPRVPIRPVTDAGLLSLSQSLLALQAQRPADPAIPEGFAVVADRLQELHDPRGELIVLELKERQLLEAGADPWNIEKIHEEISQLRQEIQTAIYTRFGITGDYQFHPQKGFSLHIDGWSNPTLISDTLERFLDQGYSYLLSQLKVTAGNLNQGNFLSESSFARLPHLRELELRQFFFGDEVLPLLIQSKHLGELRALSLYSFNVGEEGARTLAQADNLAGLRSLSLVMNELGAQGAQSLAEGPLLRPLREIEISYNSIGDEGARPLAQSFYWSELQAMGLRNNGITESGLRAFAESDLWRNLDSLDLSGNSLGNGGALVLAGSRGLSRLRHLILRDTDIGYPGARALLRSPHLSGLRSLDLRSNSISEDKMVELRNSIRSPHLVEFNGQPRNL
ncbi:MAG: hypothetical protein U1F66_11635 [bacterium]